MTTDLRNCTRQANEGQGPSGANMVTQQTVRWTIAVCVLATVESCNTSVAV
eukprot:SAG31_NODE_827_length_11749_cov_14.363090_4_plen_51_part_00